MDGILNINKPRGQTSFSIVAMFRRLTGERRVGYAGTLDPAASGVLPLCFGRATRVIEFLVEGTKTYRAEIELGITTDSYDGDGQIVRQADPSGVSRDQLESALASFCGLIRQTPPMFSAVKRQGKPLYRLARAGITVERESRPVRIDDLKLVDWQPPVATVEVVCGKGTYIRSLADDLGRVLGCGAYLKSLIRLRCGLFEIGDAVSLPQLEEAFQCGYWGRFVYPIDSVLQHWEAVVVNDETGRSIKNGLPLVIGSGNKQSGIQEGYSLPRPFPGVRCRVYALDGHFLGVLRFSSVEEQWQPEKVFL